MGRLSARPLLPSTKGIGSATKTLSKIQAQIIKPVISFGIHEEVGRSDAKRCLISSMFYKMVKVDNAP